MDTPEEAAIDANLAQAMYDDYRNILEQDIEMAPEVQRFHGKCYEISSGEGK